MHTTIASCKQWNLSRFYELITPGPGRSGISVSEHNKNARCANHIPPSLPKVSSKQSSNFKSETWYKPHSCCASAAFLHDCVANTNCLEDYLTTGATTGGPTPMFIGARRRGGPRPCPRPCSLPRRHEDGGGHAHVHRGSGCMTGGMAGATIVGGCMTGATIVGGCMTGATYVGWGMMGGVTTTGGNMP